MKRKLLCLLLAGTALLCGCARGEQTREGTMRVTFFQAGAADAILIQTPQSAVLIDAGLRGDGDALVASLREKGVERLDALVITHYDKDHVGGAPAVLEALPVAEIYQPDYVKDAKPYERWQKALQKTDAAVRTLSEDAVFTLDGARYAVSTARKRAYERDESNNFSLVVRLEWGENSFLLAGDCEEERLAELLDEGVAGCDVLKVPHHGRLDARSEEFFAAASPRWAVITSDEEEPEDAEVLALLEALGARTLLTREGEIIFETDGKTLRCTQ